MPTGQVYIFVVVVFHEAVRKFHEMLISVWGSGKDFYVLFGFRQGIKLGAMVQSQGLMCDWQVLCHGTTELQQKSFSV